MTDFAVNFPGVDPIEHRQIVFTEVNEGDDLLIVIFSGPGDTFSAPGFSLKDAALVPVLGKWHTVLVKAHAPAGDRTHIVTRRAAP